MQHAVFCAMLCARFVVGFLAPSVGFYLCSVFLYLQCYGAGSRVFEALGVGTGYRSYVLM